MDVEVKNSVSLLLERVSKRGRVATLEEINSLNQDCDGIVPAWYAELLLEYPICELEIGWQQFEPEDDFDGINWMQWSNPEMMRAEMLEAYPGVAIYKHGYLNVATCSHGSGDPYFINTNEGENPRVLQVFHDVSENYEIIVSEGIDVVAESLSEFFKGAKV
jgi:hypothetical protein